MVVIESVYKDVRVGVVLVLESKAPLDEEQVRSI